MMPLISIVVPVYNKVEYLSECIQSILGQTFRQFELILIDDGSTDGSGDICDSFLNDGRVIVLHQANQGVSGARNAGLDIAKGKYIGFVDSDDILSPDMYETLYQNAETFRADISACGMAVIFANKVRSNGLSGETFAFTRDQAMDRLLSGSMGWSANNKIYSSHVIRDIRFEGSINEDVYFSFRAFSRVDKVVFQEADKYRYMVRENSVSMSKFNPRYMQITQVSRRIVDFVRENMSNHLDQARIFDVVANLSVVNLILLSGKKYFREEYQIVCVNLDEYKAFISSSRELSIKHRYAYKLFNQSPGLYSFLLHLYCRLFDNDLLHRT